MKRLAILLLAAIAPCAHGELIVLPELDMTEPERLELIQAARSKVDANNPVAEVRAFDRYPPSYPVPHADVLFGLMDRDEVSFSIQQVSCKRRRITHTWKCEEPELWQFVYGTSPLESIRYFEPAQKRAAAAILAAAKDACPILSRFSYSSYFFKPSLELQDDGLYYLYADACSYTFRFTGDRAERVARFDYLE